jgi:hypothetical protein
MACPNVSHSRISTIFSGLTLADGNAAGLLLPCDDREAPAAREAGVQPIALKHGVMLAG